MFFHASKQPEYDDNVMFQIGNHWIEWIRWQGENRILIDATYYSDLDGSEDFKEVYKRAKEAIDHLFPE